MSDDKKTYDKRAQVDIPLEFPIEVDGEKITKLTMRRPKVKDTQWANGLSGDDFDKIVQVVARLCNVSPEHISELDDVDMEAIDRQYASFRGVTANGR